MAKNSVADLLSVDSLFTTQTERDEAQRETVRDIPLEEISDFPNHPFKVRMDEKMMEMADSVKQYGVLVPALVRPKENGGYEMIAGHRRKRASEMAGKPMLSCIIRDMTDDEATIVMVDSNLQREQILPSEKAFAYTAEEADLYFCNLWFVVHSLSTLIVTGDCPYSDQEIGHILTGFSISICKSIKEIPGFAAGTFDRDAEFRALVSKETEVI